APPNFEIGRAVVLRAGFDLTLVATGSSLKSALDAALELERTQGVQARVISMHTIKPLDVETILVAARETPWIVSIEEHSEIGGLGSAIADALTGYSGLRARLARVALPDRHIDEIGSQAHLLSRLGSVADRVRRAVA
ncbi:MAG TPA: transketolase C-terminal domain-containing protein, partial [Polyangiaceae bacterium]